MDATTLYTIVLLADGEVRTAYFVSLGSLERCQEARRDVYSRERSTNDHMRAGAKSVRFYCAPWPKTIVCANCGAPIGPKG